jgi:hypothetical protein
MGFSGGDIVAYRRSLRAVVLVCGLLLVVQLSGIAQVSPFNPGYPAQTNSLKRLAADRLATISKQLAQLDPTTDLGDPGRGFTTANCESVCAAFCVRSSVSGQFCRSHAGFMLDTIPKPKRSPIRTTGSMLKRRSVLFDCADFRTWVPSVGR